MARSLNKVQLIGNLTRDPELRYTPSGTAVCSFGLATNRSWKTDTGERREETEFHNIVAWNKLAELCSQYLVKGRKVYVEGRIATRKWTGQDGAQRSTTEIVISEMIILDSKRVEQEEGITEPVQKEPVVSEQPVGKQKPKEEKSDVKVESKEREEIKEEPKKEKPKEGASKEEVSADDIPF